MKVYVNWPQEPPAAGIQAKDGPWTSGVESSLDLTLVLNLNINYKFLSKSYLVQQRDLSTNFFALISHLVCNELLYISLLSDGSGIVKTKIRKKVFIFRMDEDEREILNLQNG